MSLSPSNLCDSGGIQTHNLLIRSQMLYSVELRNHSAPHYLICGCKGTHFFWTDQTFWRLFSKKVHFTSFLPLNSTFTSSKCLKWHCHLSRLSCDQLSITHRNADWKWGFGWRETGRGWVKKGFGWRGSGCGWWGNCHVGKGVLIVAIASVKGKNCGP